MKKEKWFQPGVHTGWDKDMSQEDRRQKVLEAHKGDNLAAGRSMMALANVTKDRETKLKAGNDALYFYREHRARMKPTNRTLRLQTKFRRLPR